LTAVAALPALATASTKTVYADAPPSAQKALGKYGASANEFFLTRIAVHQGDTVKFVITGFHTVDLPGPSKTDLPILVSDGPVTGDDDAAGNPFWFNGIRPKVFLNPMLLGPTGSSTYDGSARADSGLPLGKPKPYKIKFTKPGTYKYFCDVHPGMIGFVIVKAKGKHIPSAKQDARALAKQVKDAVSTAKRLVTTKVKGHKVSLGASARNGVEDYAMFPGKLTVKRGTVVTFAMSRTSRDFHTATFGPKSYLLPMSKAIQSASPEQQAFYPSDNPTLGPGIVTPTSHGNGFGNTGFVDRDPGTPFPASGKLKFTKKGKYRFICLIHPFMVGIIIVK
jgi:plastocyanin